MTEIPQQWNDYVKLEWEWWKLALDSWKLLDALMKIWPKDAIALYNRLSDSVSSIDAKFHDLFKTWFTDFKWDVKITEDQHTQLMDNMANEFNKAINNYINSQWKADDQLLDQIAQLSDWDNLVKVFKEKIYNLKDNWSLGEQAVASTYIGDLTLKTVQNRNEAIKEAWWGI